MKQLLYATLSLLFLVFTITTTNAQQVLSSAHEVYFGMGSSTLSAETKSTLDGLIGRLKKGTEFEVLVYGYASPEGDNDYNMKLSEKRIMAVYNYIVDAGITDEKVRYRIPRGEEMYRSLYYKGEEVPKGKRARFVEILITPKIDLVDPSGATKIDVKAETTISTQ